MYATAWVLSRICRPQEEPLSAGRVRTHTCCECYNKRGNFFFFIFRLMRYTDVCFFSLSGVQFPREYIPQLNETVKRDNIRESDRHDRRYMYIPSFALPIYKTTRHAKPYLRVCCFCCCCCCCCYCTTYCWLVLLGVFFFFFQLSCESYMVMDVVVQNPQKRSGYDQGTTIAGWSCSVFYFLF